jgi:spore coat polysaccharide biosynthesis protein SpsF
LKKSADVEALFVMRQDPVGLDFVRKSGYPVGTLVTGETSEVMSVYRGFAPDLIFNDILYTGRGYVEAAKTVAPVVNYDDIGEGRRSASVVIDATVKPDGSGLQGIPYFHGPEYLLLRDSFRELRETVSRRDLPDQAHRVLVLMGGSDPTGLTARVVAEINQIPSKLELLVVTGAGYRSPEALETLLDNSHHDAVLHSAVPADRLIRMMRDADAGIVQCGISAYEMACVGLPFVAIAHSEEEDRFGRVGEYGFCRYLGWGGLLGRGDIRESLEELINDRRLRLRLSETGMKTVDARWCSRVAGILLETMGR